MDSACKTPDELASNDVSNGNISQIVRIDTICANCANAAVFGSVIVNGTASLLRTTMSLIQRPQND